MAFQNKKPNKNNLNNALKSLEQFDEWLKEEWEEYPKDSAPNIPILDYDNPDFDIENFNINDFIKQPRENIPPPEEPIIDKTYNPYGYHDIVTFCEHPYFLNLTLMPWQKIIVKSLYMGTYGNFGLNIDDNHTEDCSGCVWNYNKKQEEKYYTGNLINIKVESPDMILENSPCLQCVRLDDKVRDFRYNSAIEITPGQEEREEIIALMDRALKDMFQTELDLINTDLKEKVKEQILDKVVRRRRRYSELMLVLGRRSGKSFMVSIIALYATYRLIRQGHPQAYCPAKLPDHQVIGLLNVAKSSGQAKRAIFAPMVQFVTSSPFFRKYLNQDKILLNEMYLYTPFDLEHNERMRKEGFTKLSDGTIHVYSGHSKAGSLVGDTMYLIIIDEMAAMVTSKGEEGVDSELYDMLKPSLATFGNEGLIAMISNPLRAAGRFYDLYQDSFDDKNTLMVQLPTWCSNPNIPKGFLDAQRRKDRRNFGMHYGAEFGSDGDHPFLPREFIDMAFDKRKNQRRAIQGIPLVNYFAHVDPALSSDYYAIAIVHCEPLEGNFKDLKGRPMQKVIVDYIHYFEPDGPGKPISRELVDNHIIKLHNYFRFSLVTYDHMLSAHSIQNLISHGINAKMTTYNAPFQQMIWGNLYELFIDERIEFYGVDSSEIDINRGGFKSLNECKMAKNQFIALQKKFIGKRYKIEALAPEHDDIPDCVAGAAYQAINTVVHNSLPRPKAVALGPRFR